MMRYLFHLAHDHVNFRLYELKSIASIFGINLSFSCDHNFKGAFLVVNLPNEELARKISQRSVLVKSCVELWASAGDYSSLYEQLKNLPKDFVETHNKEEKSFRIKVEAFNRNLNLKEKISKIENLTSNGIDLKGSVDLSDNCSTTFHLLEDYGPPHSNLTLPLSLYFGRWICDGNRNQVNKYDLSKRRFIGNTSMDPTLAMIMANMARVTPGSISYDPFVGTGSLLIACAHFGSYVLGSDIDYNLIMGVGKSSRAGQKWRSREESVKSNLTQYNLRHLYLDLLLADASLINPMWNNLDKTSPTVYSFNQMNSDIDVINKKICNNNETKTENISQTNTCEGSLELKQGLFDAILADPPYGIREPSQKIGFKKTPSPTFTIQPELRDLHHPCKRSYHMSDLINDLIIFSAKYLVMGGRLVYWMPVFVEDYSDSNIPKHRCLKLVSNCEQPLNNKVSRRLITMEKISYFKGEEDQQAVVEKGHYEEASFREKYFRSTQKT